LESRPVLEASLISERGVNTTLSLWFSTFTIFLAPLLAPAHCATEG
jgi:hypothetical protein